MSRVNHDLSIRLDHITRVEGHGSIRINIRKGEVEEVKLMIVEANRFFENLVRGMRPHDVPQLVSRICGICCVGHQLAAIKAVEAAQGIEVTPRTILMRKLLNESQFLQSHLLHVYFLAVPDYVGAASVLPLAKSHPEIVRRALRLKKLANDFTAVFGGRTLHPMSLTIGGWRREPERQAVEAIRQRLMEALPDLEETVAIVAGLTIPDYQRETEYVSLRHPEEYALYDGEIYSSDLDSTRPVSDYRQITNEFTVAHSTTKWSRWNRDSYMVGALARVNNNFGQLHPRAQEVAERLGLTPPCFNPYMNNIAQVVEIVHCAHNCLAMLDQWLEGQAGGPLTLPAARAGSGAGATEVPRGTLFHAYTFDDEGLCCDADAVIPTSQNINNIEQDMRAFAPLMVESLDEKGIALHLEMLLRAYDPCISCSVHMLDVEFV
jgi:sulfhydrogenase subunit alpha